MMVMHHQLKSTSKIGHTTQKQEHSWVKLRGLQFALEDGTGGNTKWYLMKNLQRLNQEHVTYINQQVNR